MEMDWKYLHILHTTLTCLCLLQWHRIVLINVCREPFSCLSCTCTYSTKSIIIIINFVVTLSLFKKWEKNKKVDAILASTLRIVGGRWRKNRSTFCEKTCLITVTLSRYCDTSPWVGWFCHKCTRSTMGLKVAYCYNSFI